LASRTVSSLRLVAIPKSVNPDFKCYCGDYPAKIK
jgi:hypothetical protein